MNEENDIYSHLPPDLKKIHESKGMQFINDQKMRTFSLNILYMNATKLIEEAGKLQDPDIGLFLMFESNRDAGEQAHREINRHIHNFVAAAKTLVDHTRVFLDGRYAGEEILVQIKQRISETFNNSPVCKFVHDLRNYMLHKGLPNSEMYLHGTNTGADGQMHIATGVRIKSLSLLDFSGWTAPAKAYIYSSGEYIDISEFAQQYINEIQKFDEWLIATLYQNHNADLIELSQLQNATPGHQSESGGVPPLEVKASSPLADKLEQGILEISAKESVDSIGDNILSKINPVEKSRLDGSGFKSARANIVQIKDEDLLSDPVNTMFDTLGRKTISFIHDAGQSYGLLETDLDALHEIITKVSADDWAKGKFDIEFLEQVFYDWARIEFSSHEGSSFYEYLKSRTFSDITKHEVYFPIANFEVENDIEFGPLKITTLKPAFFEHLESMTEGLDAEFKSQAESFIGKLKLDFQGVGAIELTIDAHESVVTKSAFALATDAVDILRFFAPQAAIGDARCPMALSGSEYLPQKKVLMLSAKGFTTHEGLMPEFFGHWQLSEEGIASLCKKGLLTAGALLESSTLNQFSRSVKTAIIMFSKGSTMINLADRLHYTMSALEEVLLQHRIESVESCISKRASYLAANNADDRKQIQVVINKSYGLRNQYKSIYSTSETHAINMCIFIAHSVISTTLLNVSNFLTNREFVSALEKQYKECG